MSREGLGRQARKSARRDAGTSGKRFDTACRPKTPALRVAPGAPPASSTASTIGRAMLFGPLLADRATPARDDIAIPCEKSGLDTGPEPPRFPLMRLVRRRQLADSVKCANGRRPITLHTNRQSPWCFRFRAGRLQSLRHATSSNLHVKTLQQLRCSRRQGLVSTSPILPQNADEFRC